MSQKIQITQKRSSIGCTQAQQSNLMGLGLRKRGNTVVREDTPSIRGMIRKVIHLIDVSRPETKTKSPEKVSGYEVKTSATNSKATTQKATKKTTKKSTKKAEA